MKTIEDDEMVFIFDEDEGSPYVRRFPPNHEIIPTHSLASSVYDLNEMFPQVPGKYNSRHRLYRNCDDKVIVYVSTQEQNNNLIYYIRLVRSACDTVEFGKRSSVAESMRSNYSMYRLHHAKSQRIISKLGERNFNLLHIPQRSRRFFVDLVTTVVEKKWNHVIIIFLLMTFGCWIVFAGLWYLICYSHGDLNTDPNGMRLIEGVMPCVEGVTTMTGFFLMSFEVQTTVGFGERYPTEECPEGIFMFILQIVTGIMIDGALVGIIYTKLVRPPRRPVNFKFSQKAVVCQRDSKLCLLFRVCDPNELHVIDTKVRAYLIEKKITAEGEVIQQYQQPLKLHEDGHILIIFPLTVCHVIDSHSPFYNLSACDFVQGRFEILVTLSGASRSTGQCTEERTSYLSREVLWGQRFVNLVHYDPENRVHVIEYDEFDVTEQIDTPLCSAKRLDDIRNGIEKAVITNQSKPKRTKYYYSKINNRILAHYNSFNESRKQSLKTNPNTDSEQEDASPTRIHARRSEQHAVTPTKARRILRMNSNTDSEQEGPASPEIQVRRHKKSPLSEALLNAESDV